MGNQGDEMVMTMRRELDGRQKAGYLLVGVFLGVGGVLLASLCNLNAPYRSDCTKFSAIGLGVGMVLSAFGTLLNLPLAALL